MGRQTEREEKRERGPQSKKREEGVSYRSIHLFPLKVRKGDKCRIYERRGAKEIAIC